MSSGARPRPLFVVRGAGGHELARLPRRRGMRDVAKAEEPDHALVVVDDGEAADLLALHDAQRLIEAVAISTVDDALGHHITGRQLADVAAVGQTPTDDVAVGDHADEAIVL